MTNTNVKKLHIVTHGCQMNEYDSARMRDLLGDSHQMITTENPEENKDMELFAKLGINTENQQGYSDEVTEAALMEAVVEAQQPEMFYEAS